MELWIHSFVNSEMEWLLSSTPRPLYTFDKTLDGIQSRSGNCADGINLLLLPQMGPRLLELPTPILVPYRVHCSYSCAVEVQKENVLPSLGFSYRASFNRLKPELNSICYLLALLGAHHFLHVSRIRVKLLTFRLLMSYIWSTHS